MTLVKQRRVPSANLPTQHLDFIFQRVLLALQGLLIDDFDGVELAGSVSAFGESNLGEGAAEIEKLLHVGDK